MIIPLLCSYETVEKEIETPYNVLRPPRRIVCVHCDQISDTFYKKVYKYCQVCFCLNIPCGAFPRYLACKRCKKQLNIYSDVYKCKNCTVETIPRVNYCPMCGKKK